MADNESNEWEVEREFMYLLFSRRCAHRFVETIHLLTSLLYHSISVTGVLDPTSYPLFDPVWSSYCFRDSGRFAGDEKYLTKNLSLFYLLHFHFFF